VAGLEQRRRGNAGDERAVAAAAVGVYPVPEALDREVARLKLASLGVRIDALTPEQEAYLASWESGT
jgi:S-adenosylhomocysteine hydrolase